MNSRTITHNAQLAELTNALKPTPTKPEPLSSTWPVLHENSLQTMKIANKNCVVEYMNDNMLESASIMIVILLIFFSVLKLLK